MIHKELNHVNVVQMHHYFEDNLNVYMLLEACPRKVSYIFYLPYQFIVSYRAYERKISQLFPHLWPRIHLCRGIHLCSTTNTRSLSRKLFKLPTDIDNWSINKACCSLILAFFVLYLGVFNIFVYRSPFVKCFPSSSLFLLRHEIPARLKSKSFWTPYPRNNYGYSSYLSENGPWSATVAYIFISLERERHLHSSWLICPTCLYR